MKSTSLRRFLFPLVALLALAGLAAPSPVMAEIIDDADQGGRSFFVWMTGAEEAPGPGDPDGSGTALITLNQGQGQVCWELTVTGIAPATAAHIHIAPAGSPGPVVIPLSPPTSGFSSGCASVDPELIKAIRQSPAAYYVNVHNEDYRAGAIRAQLSK
jgi:hypothetical protein